MSCKTITISEKDLSSFYKDHRILLPLYVWGELWSNSGLSIFGLAAVTQKTPKQVLKELQDASAYVKRYFCGSTMQMVHSVVNTNVPYDNPIWQADYGWEESRYLKKLGNETDTEILRKFVPPKAEYGAIRLPRILEMRKLYERWPEPTPIKLYHYSY